MLKFIIAFLSLSMIQPVLAAESDPGKTFGSQSFTLENGMQVVVIPNHRTPVVTHMVWYNVGAADEPYGQSGMAHYFEHLMFKGTDTLEPGDFSRTVKKLGGNDNAFTSQDFTAYFQSISVDHLEKVMQMEADRMVNLNPPADHFASEKGVVIEERRQRTDNDPRGLFYEQLNSLLYINHPYGIPVIGWMNEIEGYEWQDVKTFYDRWYAPNNAILVVSGDITAEELKPMAENIYGPLKAKELPNRTRPKIAPADGNTFLIKNHERIQQPLFHKAYLAPSTAQNKHHSYGLQVLTEILSGGPTTRLYRSLVVEQKKATSVSLSYSSNARNTTTIDISATPADGVSMEDIERFINEQILKIIQDGPTKTEVTEAITRLQDQAVFARDSVAGPAMIFGRMLTTGSSIEDIENWADDIALVTPTLVQEVAKLYLNDEQPYIRPPVVGHLLPKPSDMTSNKGAE